MRLHAAAVGCDEIDEAQACGKHAAGEGNEGRGTAQGVPVTWLALHAVVMLLELTSFRSCTHPPAVMMGLLTVQLLHALLQFTSR